MQSLGAEGPFTVFAPRNSAFDKLPEGELDVGCSCRRPGGARRASCSCTVVAGDLYRRPTLRQQDHDADTLSGLSIIVDGFNGLNVGGVNVVQPDVMASNGIIQVVDGIIMPPPERGAREPRPTAARRRSVHHRAGRRRRRPPITRPPSPTVTGTLAPSRISPESSFSASWSCSSFWITRFSGRAP